MTTASDFTEADSRQLAERGIPLDEARRQIALLRQPPEPVRLVRPCTVGDGVVQVAESRIPHLVALHDDAASQGRLIKFVPASGAATRMFQDLLALQRAGKSAPSQVKAAGALRTFLSGIRGFAFFEELRAALARQGRDLDVLVAHEAVDEILGALLGPDGLDYAETPKGLVKFHRYGDETRTAFEEHLTEAAALVPDASGACRLHLTVSPDHEGRFRALLDQVRPRHERRLNVRFQVDLSFQRSSTETLALDEKGEPFRDEAGRLLLRPGGHGSLIENLNDLGADIVHIKNIDNVASEALLEKGLLWKKVLTGYLLEQERELGNTLRRPLRVCGVVPNAGQAGGGPFWVRGKDGSLSLQIVEGAQLDVRSKEQQRIFASSTHFNPVDMVCGLRDADRRPFDLLRCVDPDAVIFARKSWRGRDLLAFERPGLWNGAMAGFHTIFVEIPGETFTPVKTVTDLLRSEHQPSG